MTGSDARRVACEWQGGDRSALHAFGRTGRVLAGAVVEARECCRLVDGVNVPASVELHALEDWLIARLG